MFTGEKHRADSDSRSQDVREYHLYPGLWDRLLGRSRGRYPTQSRWLFRQDAGWFSAGARRKQLLHSEHAERASGLHRRRDRDGREHYGQRHHKAIAVCLSSLLLACVLSCSRTDGPQAAFEHAQLTFQHGDLIHSQQEAEAGYRRFLGSNPEWAWKFRILQAESLLWRGKYPEVLALLDFGTRTSAPQDTIIPVLTLRGIAHARQLDLEAATRDLAEAERLCTPAAAAGCGEAFQGLGIFDLGQNQFSAARQQFELSLSFARAHSDRFLETTSLLNLGGVLVKEGRFDEAIDRSDAAYKASVALGAGDIALAAQENVGWAYYRLGDSERALQLLQEAERRADQLGDVFDQENGLTNVGYIYMDAHDSVQAEQSFQQALILAKLENSKEHVLNALRVLARLALQMGDVKKGSG